ncbi:MAG: MBL fold metallo-hydrolase [Clostridiales bacterium]|nr:MBL fold metallo-hydrolase [Clostridiales bacterium]
MKPEIPFYKAEVIAENSRMISNAFTGHSYALCYLVEGRDYALLIDSILGIGNLKAFCETLTDKPIVPVNTHAHSDHFGGNFFFDTCYMHHRDIAAFQDGVGKVKKQQIVDLAKGMALEEYRDLLEPDDNFADWDPMKVLPLYGGDVFDLGDRKIEVVEVGGHTAGSIVLIDPLTRIAYSGDACNGNTLLEFPDSLPIASYMKNLLRLKERQGEFDKMYGGHEIFDASIVDEAIETVGRVIAGTDDRVEAKGILGYPVFYAAAKVKDGYERADGKRFNMTYLPGKILGPDREAQAFTLPREQ